MVMMSWFAHGDSRIYFEEEGQGESVLVLPGWAGSIGEFGPVRQSLAPHYRVIAADLPGSGQSGPQPREYTATYLRDDAEAFLALLDDLSVSPAHLVGFSDGGELALLMAELRPDAVRSVVAWGAAGQVVAPPEMLDAMYHLIDEPIPPLADFAEFLKATYGEDNARAMTQSLANALRAIIEAGGDISASHVADIRCPVLLMTGEHDPFCPPPLVSELASAIPGGEFLRVDEVGHDIHTARPEWMAGTVLNWLQKSRVDGPSVRAMGTPGR